MEWQIAVVPMVLMAIYVTMLALHIKGKMKVGEVQRAVSEPPLRSENGYEISSVELSRDDVFDALLEKAAKMKAPPEHDRYVVRILKAKNGTVEKVIVSYYRNHYIGKGKLWLAKG